MQSCGPALNGTCLEITLLGSVTLNKAELNWIENTTFCLYRRMISRLFCDKAAAQSQELSHCSFYFVWYLQLSCIIYILVIKVKDVNLSKHSFPGLY